jgi:hypothetical protein
MIKLTFSNFIFTLLFPFCFIMGSCELESKIVAKLNGQAPSGAAELAPVPVTAWPVFDNNIYVSLQDTSLNDYLYQFEFDTSAALGSALSIVDSSLVTVNGNIRGIAMDINGQIIAGGSSEMSPPIYSKDYVLQKNLSPTGAIDPEVNSHAICSFPNGNYIIAEEADVTGNIANEYDQDDNFVRTVYSTVLGDHGAIGECYAPNNSTLILVEVEAWALTESNMIKMQLVGNSWTIDQQINSETLFPATDSNYWAFAYHNDGNVYFAPFRRDGARSKKLLRCPLNDISTGSCSSIGDDIPGEGAGNYLTWVRGIAQIPGSNDLIVFLSQEVYHYNYSTGAYTSIMDLTATVPAIDVIRSVILAPK